MIVIDGNQPPHPNKAEHPTVTFRVTGSNLATRIEWTPGADLSEFARFLVLLQTGRLARHVAETLEQTADLLGDESGRHVADAVADALDVGPEPIVSAEDVFSTLMKGAM